MSATATKSKSKSKKGAKAKKAAPNRYLSMSYLDLLKEANKPILERRELPIGRNGANKTIRRHHLPEHQVDQLKAAARDGDVFPNPQNRGCYYYIIEALKTMGLNTSHRWDHFANKVEALMSAPETKDEDGKTAWQRFAKKPQRSDKGRDVDGRLRQNCEVLQRVNLVKQDGQANKNPYGLKINQVAQEVLKLKGACIDILRESPKHATYIALNTEPKEFNKYELRDGTVMRVPIPINDLKQRRGADEDEAPVKTVKPKKAAVKAEKPKAAKKVAKKRPAKKVEQPVIEPTVEEPAPIASEVEELAEVAAEETVAV